MIDPHIAAELNKILDSLEIEEQRAVLSHAKQVANDAKLPRGTPAGSLCHLFGIMSEEAADELEMAIEECNFVPVPFWHPHESIY
jgi:hypothetical protein